MNRPVASRRPRWVWRLMLPVLPLALIACAEGPQTVSADRCDPFAPACPADQVCAVTDDGPRCRRPVQPLEGRACAAASCPTGEACATVEGLLRCRPLCRVDGACPDGPLCGYRLAGSNLGVCPARCRPSDDCGVGGTCGISAALPYPICVAVGTADEDEPCSATRCAAGLGCLEVPDPSAPDSFVERCVRLCDPRGAGGDCPGSHCDGVVLGVDGAGYCTDDS